MRHSSWEQEDWEGFLVPSVSQAGEVGAAPFTRRHETEGAQGLVRSCRGQGRPPADPHPDPVTLLCNPLTPNTMTLPWPRHLPHLLQSL